MAEDDSGPTDLGGKMLHREPESSRYRDACSCVGCLLWRPARTLSLQLSRASSTHSPIAAAGGEGGLSGVAVLAGGRIQLQPSNPLTKGQRAPS